jgi:hypothetical protein
MLRIPVFQRGLFGLKEPEAAEQQSVSWQIERMFDDAAPGWFRYSSRGFRRELSQFPQATFALLSFTVHPK